MGKIKALFCALLLSVSLVAEEQCHLQLDQLEQFQRITCANNFVYSKAMELCRENGYKYFVFEKLSYADKDGQTMEFLGPKGILGERIKGNLSEADFGGLQGLDVAYEIVCLKEESTVALANNVDNFYRLIEAFQKQNEVVIGAQVTEVSRLEDLHKVVKESKVPVFVDFYSTSCTPCKVLSPQFDQYSIDFSDKGVFLKVNIAEAEEIREAYGVESVPTLLIFKEGELSETKTGLPLIIKALSSL